MNEKSEKKLRLGIDLDDTVWKTIENIIKYYNLKNKTDYKVSDCYDYSMREFLGITKEEKLKILNNYNEEMFSEELFLLDGFLEIFEKIQDKFEIFFITARPSGTKKFVLERMKKVFGDGNEEKIPIHFCLDLEKDIYIPKVDICQELGIDIMIDDGLHHLKECSEKGIKCLLLDYPWNRDDTLGGNIIRVDTWNDIFKELEKLL